MFRKISEEEFNAFVVDHSKQIKEISSRIANGTSSPNDLMSQFNDLTIAFGNYFQLQVPDAAFESIANFAESCAAKIIESAASAIESLSDPLMDKREFESEPFSNGAIAKVDIVLKSKGNPFGALGVNWVREGSTPMSSIKNELDNFVLGCMQTIANETKSGCVFRGCFGDFGPVKIEPQLA